MVIIHNSYLYIKNEIEIIKKNQTDITQLEDNFKSFCKIQESVCPEFNYIYELSNQFEYNTKFNKFFLEKQEEYNPYNDGYGDMMISSETTPKYTQYADILIHIKKNEKDEKE